MSRYLLENDYSADFLRWIKRAEERDIQVNKCGKDRYRYSPIELEEFQKEIIAEQDSAMAYFFTCDYSYKPYLMQKIIIDNQDAKYAYIFAQNIRNADIRALQKVIIRANDTKYACKFACFVPGADIKPLEKMVIRSGKAKYAHSFIKHVKHADINKFKSIILNSKKPMYLFELAKHTRDLKELAYIEDLVIAARSFTYMRLMAEKIPNANIEKLEQAVLDTNNTDEAVKFAKNVKKSKMKHFFLVL